MAAGQDRPREEMLPARARQRHRFFQSEYLTQQKPSFYVWLDATTVADFDIRLPVRSARALAPAPGR